MSSGDLLADRRMEMARALLERGESDAAIEILEQAMELVPGWTAGFFLLGEWQAVAGRREEAIAAYERALALDPADRMGAVLRLALLGAAAEPPAPPEAYVTGVFDGYANAFDEALVERLDYRVPAELQRLVDERVAAAATFQSVLDLGCGTGLAGERFRSRCMRLDGVDLSDGMLAHARRKAIYDRLERAEVTAWLEGVIASYDLIVAADVLVYLGDLVPLAARVAEALLPGGRFVFSTEATAGEGYRLTAGQRYAHSEAYLRRALGEAGLEIAELRRGMCRLEKGEPVEGLFVLARRGDTVSPPDPHREHEPPA